LQSDGRFLAVNDDHLEIDPARFRREAALLASTNVGLIDTTGELQ
jgi:hypothetical protein